MAINAWKERATEPDIVETLVSLTGVGAGNPTKNFGRGVTATRPSTGLINITWTDFPGVYVGVTGHLFEGTTPSGLAGYTVVVGDYNPATKTIQINITNSSNVLTDLAATQRLSITFAFKWTNA